MTQTEIDELCVMAQNAITVLVQDFILMYKGNDIWLQKRAAQLLGLNSCMLAIKDYDLANWTDLSTDDLEIIKEKIVWLSDWRY